MPGQCRETGVGHLIVFGLSMDYEVFLLSRIKEEYEVGAIIQVLFHPLVFLLSRIKEEYERIGDATNSVADGLAAAARVTAAAAMVELLGARDWWLSHWLDRIIPNLEVDPRGEPAYPAGFHR